MSQVKESPERTERPPAEVPDRHPLVVKTPDVCGGSARLIRTRIAVWSLVLDRRLGLSEADILRNLPTLRAVDLAQAWAYAADHAEEIEAEIRANEED